MKPDISQDTSCTWLQRAQGPKHEAGKLQGPGQKILKLARQGALSKPWRRRLQGPTCIREQVNNWPRSIGERDGAETGAPGGSWCPPRVLELPGRWLLLDPSCHGWPCVVKPWWSSGDVPTVHQGTCTFDGDINLILSLLLIYFDACLLSFTCVASMWP
jgi:hypothetical protein